MHCNPQNVSGSDIAHELAEAYKSVLHGIDTPLVREDMSMENYLERQADDDFDRYLRDHMTAATFTTNNISSSRTKVSIIGHFNNEAFHTPGNFFCNNIIVLVLNGLDIKLHATATSVRNHSQLYLCYERMQ